MRRFQDIYIVCCHNDFILTGNLRSLKKNWPDIVNFGSIKNKTGPHRIQSFATWEKFQPKSGIRFLHQALSSISTKAPGKIARRASLFLAVFLLPRSALCQGQWHRRLGLLSLAVMGHYLAYPQGYRLCIQSQAESEKLELDEGRGTPSVSQGVGQAVHRQSQQELLKGWRSR